MSMEVKCVGRCAQITMKNNENKITGEFVESFHRALDAVENFEDVSYLVTTGEGKFFSTGVDVDLVRSPDPVQFIKILSELQKLLARLLTFPLVTVAAINGHCVGGGVMLALSHDHRVMRNDRGWFFIPIVRLKHTLPLGLLNLAKSRICQPAVHRMVVNAQRFSADEGLKLRVIDATAPPSSLVETAMKKGAESSKGLDRRTLRSIKQELYYELYQLLTEPIQFSTPL